MPTNKTLAKPENADRQASRLHTTKQAIDEVVTEGECVALTCATSPQGELFTTEQLIDEVTTKGEGIGLVAGVRLLPPASSGKPLDPSTLYRWCTVGTTGAGGQIVRLEALRLGRRLTTSRAALARFVRAQNSPTVEPAPTTKPSPTRPERLKRQPRGSAILDRAGV